MRRKVISSASLLSLVLSTILTLSAIYSGVGIAKADSVIATIPVGGLPLYLALDTINGNLYVPNHEDNTVSVISGQTNSVIGNPIAVRDTPLGIAFDSTNGNLYVANDADNTVSVISGQTNTVIGNPIPVGQAPFGIAFDSTNNNLYVASYGDNTVSVISGQTNTVVDSIKSIGNGHPYSIAFDSTNGNLYVVNYAGYNHDSVGNTVSVISGQTNTVVGDPIPVGTDPHGIAFDSTNNNLYVTNYSDNTVSVISGQSNSVVGNPIAVGTNPYGIAFDSANSNIYETNSGINTVSVISTTHSTTLTLNAIANVPSGTTITVTGKLTDNVGGAGVAGKTITFTGTGAGNIASVTTNPNGTFTATGLAPASVNNGWTVQAHFAGDSLYAPADSSVQSYNTVRTTPIPPDTTITSAVDGNGVTITNGSTTFSSSIRFTFTATAGTNPVASFECSLDNNAFSSCSSPATLANLAAGKHTFQVRAVDTSGNRDPTPASFSWTIATLTPPTKTTITSAIDGNNAPVQNGGTTSSNSITFTFTATQGSNPIAGFQCSLDNSPLSSCSSPASFNNLAAGPHKFAVVAVDTKGNKDPNPATFSWTIGTSVTPTQSIQQLIQLKHSMHLDPGTDRLLDSQLNAALQFVQHNLKSGACGHLNGFVIQVQAALQVGHITQTQATQLIQAAQNIQTALGCTSGNGIVASSLSASQTSSSSNNNLTQGQQSKTTASSPSLFQPQSQPPYPYSNQYRYPSQYPYLSQIPQSQSPQNQKLPPVANAGISQTVNENTKVTLDGRASYSPTGGVIVAYQWTQLATGVPVVLTAANTATPTFTTSAVPVDTPLAFSLRVLDNHGSISTNPSDVYVTVKHNPNNIGTIGGNTPRTSVIPPQQQEQQPSVPNNNEISPPSQANSAPSTSPAPLQLSPIITIPGKPTMK